MAVLLADPVRSYCDQRLVAKAKQRGEGRHTAVEVAEAAGVSVADATTRLEGRVDANLVGRDDRDGETVYYVSECDRLRRLGKLVSKHPRDHLRERREAVAQRLARFREEYDADDVSEADVRGEEAAEWRRQRMREDLLDDAVVNYPYYDRRMVL